MGMEETRCFVQYQSQKSSLRVEIFVPVDAAGRSASDCSRLEFSGEGLDDGPLWLSGPDEDGSFPGWLCKFSVISAAPGVAVGSAGR